PPHPQHPAPGDIRWRVHGSRQQPATPSPRFVERPIDAPRAGTGQSTPRGAGLPPPPVATKLRREPSPTLTAESAPPPGASASAARGAGDRLIRKTDGTIFDIGRCAPFSTIPVVPSSFPPVQLRAPQPSWRQLPFRGAPSPPFVPQAP